MRAPLFLPAVLPLALIGGAMLWPAVASAQTGQMNISMPLPSTCTIATMPMQFGTLNTTSLGYDRKDATATWTIACTANTSLTYAWTSANISGCQLRLSKNGSGGPWINYEIYRTSAYGAQASWFCGTAPTLTTPTGSPQTYTFYGRIPAASAMEIGDYSDTLTLTLSY